MKKPFFAILILAFFFSTFATAKDWVYTVRSGDTLWDLCRQYTKLNDCWLKIGPYNNVEYPRIIAPGTRIRFPVEWLLEPPVPVEVTYVRGSVAKINVDNEETPLIEGEELTIGTRVVVGDDSFILLTFADRSVMTVEENTSLTLDVLSKFENSGMVDTRVHLQKGSVHTRVPARTPRSRFEISTPSSVAAVRGTEFRVSSDDSVTRNEVFEGAVHVAKEEESKSVPEGNGLIANKDKPLPEVVPLLPKPRFPPIEDMQAMPFVLAWQEVEHAKRYHVKVALRDKAEQILLLQYTEGNEFTLRGLSDDCYSITLSAIDENGLQGMPNQSYLCLYNELAPPSGVKVESVKSRQIQLSWQPVPGALNYRIDFSDTADFAANISSTTATETKINWQVHRNKNQYARIVALGDNGVEGKYSEVLRVYEKEPNDKWLIGGFFVFVISVILLI